MITKEEFCKRQDHALLRQYCTNEEVEHWCAQAVKYGFASVCVNPCEVERCRKLLEGTSVGLGTVVGYPQGVNTTETKIFEALDAIDRGAEEVDVVMNVSRFKNGEYDYVRDELTRIVSAVKEKKASVLVKVIIERHWITDEELPIACELLIDAKADFIKEATGYAGGENHMGAFDIRLIKSIVGDRIRVKSAFGPGQTPGELVLAIEYGAERVGGNMSDILLERTPDDFWAK